MVDYTLCKIYNQSGITVHKRINDILDTERLIIITRGNELSSQSNINCDSKITDSVQISIIKHELFDKKINGIDNVKYLTVHFKNTSDSHISKVSFAVLFYDAQHNLLDTVEQDFSDFKIDTIRVINVETARAISSQIESYELVIKSINKLPKSIATGSAMVEIIKHDLLIGADPYDSTSTSGIIELSIGAVSLAIRNISDKVLSTIIFKVELYDVDNNLIDTIRHEEYELTPFSSRAFMITSSKYAGNHAASYKVSIIKTLTPEVEKVQLRRHDKSILPDGGERISGLLKNLSSEKADSAVIVTLLDSKNERIGTKVAIIKEIAPGSIKRFSFDFYPPCGEKSKSYSIEVGDI